jgi:hypothetical protein
LHSFAAGQPSGRIVAENLAYLEKRELQMQYPSFVAQGWPIGSGMVESANKVVVEARLKGAGMHWSRASVNPLLALRNAVCTDRWAEAWQQSVAHIQREGMCRRSVEPKSAPAENSSDPASVPIPAMPISESAAPVAPPNPAAEHPWRQKNRATKAAIAQAHAQARL